MIPPSPSLQNRWQHFLHVSEHFHYEYVDSGKLQTFWQKKKSLRWKTHLLPHQLLQISCGFGDICDSAPPVQPTRPCVPRFPVVRREVGRRVCLCLCVKVVRHLLWSDEGALVGKNPQSTAKSGTLRHCDFKCVFVYVRQSECGVRQCQGAFKMRLNVERSLLIVNDSYRKASSNLGLTFSSYPKSFTLYQPDGAEGNFICQFHSVVNWIFHLATELRLNFKVILINTPL